MKNRTARGVGAGEGALRPPQEFDAADVVVWFQPGNSRGRPERRRDRWSPPRRWRWVGSDLPMPRTLKKLPWPKFWTVVDGATNWSCSSEKDAPGRPGCRRTGRSRRPRSPAGWWSGVRRSPRHRSPMRPAGRQSVAARVPELGAAPAHSRTAADVVSQSLLRPMVFLPRCFLGALTAPWGGPSHRSPASSILTRRLVKIDFLAGIAKVLRSTQGDCGNVRCRGDSS